MISSLKAALLLALPTIVSAQTSGVLNAEANVQVIEGPCTAYIEIIEGDGDKEMLVGDCGSGIHYVVPQVDTAWIEEKRKSGELVSGVTVLDLPENTMVDKQTYAFILAGPPGLLN